MSNPSSQEEPDLPPDAQLVESARAGDSDAFGQLWTRHSSAALRAAYQFAYAADPEDLVAEAYTRILAAIRDGKGPSGAFRPYLLVTIRNLAIRTGRSNREDAVDDLESFEKVDFPADPAVAALDRSLTAKAFRSLPERWQTVLWYTAVEGMSPLEASSLLGLSANSTAALAHRARDGLRQAWIQAHVNDDASSRECKWMLGRMSQFTRGELSARNRARAMAHLATCAKCLIVSEEIDDISSRLAIVMIPLLLGGVAGAGYIAANSGPAGAPTAAGGHGGDATIAVGAGGISRGTVGWLAGAGLAAVIVTAGATWGLVALTSVTPVAHDAIATTPSEPLAPQPTTTPTPPGAPQPDDTAIPAPATPPTPSTPKVPVTPSETTEPLVPPVVEPPIIDPPLDTIALPPTITTTPDPESLTPPTIAGTAEPGATVTVTDQDGIVVATVIADDTGSWSTGQLTALLPTTTALDATQKDVTGNVSAPVTIGPFAFHPAFVFPAEPVVSGPTLDLDLAGWTGAEVIVSLDGVDFTSPPGEQWVFDASGKQTRHVTFGGSGTHVIGIRYLGADPSTEVTVTVTSTP